MCELCAACLEVVRGIEGRVVDQSRKAMELMSRLSVAECELSLDVALPSLSVSCIARALSNQVEERETS
jgi:RNase P/RNase MRP subunit p29